ncbi:MAG TPA: nucleotidyltransferase family protein, partial [Candidatus Xenobia bacterium]
MTPGEKWLIDRLAEVVSGTTDGSARALQEDEQGHVMGFGLRNRILPVLFGRGRRELFPPSMLAVMRAAYHDQAVRNLRGFALLGGVLRSLSDREIPVIVLKGGFLAENVYRNIACRPMYDFDLLVRQANREEVDRILSAQGFSLTVPDKPLPESIYQHSATSMRLEIHWHISADQRSSFEVEDLWAGTMPTTVGGAHALALRPEVLLAHLCEHFTHHAFVLPALHLFDIAMVVRHYGAELDWPQFVVLARRWNMRRATFLLLRQVERL